MPDVRIGLGICAALAAFGAGAQSMYKWVDEKGVTHFSEHPPPDSAKATKVTPKVTPPGNPAAYNPQSWKSSDTEFKKRQIERGKSEDLEARQRNVDAHNCGVARNRLARLQEANDVIRYNDKGEQEFLSQKERAEQIAHAKDLVKQHCN